MKTIEDGKIAYVSLSLGDISRGLFDAFVRRQEVGYCLRYEQGAWKEKYCPFIDDWSEKDYEAMTARLKDILAKGGDVFATFFEGELKAFAALSPEFFGSCREYLDLAELYVSAEMRGKGIGSRLFELTASRARRKGARKLYISAHSAVESQAFYCAMGCVDAAEPDAAHVAAEPFDRQLEYRL